GAMQVPEHAFREYDIRGVAKRDLNDALATAIGRALVTAVAPADASKRVRVAVARDCRESSDRLFAALTTGLQASGADVVDVGIGPSPLLYFAAHHLGTDAAVMITGSHNPAQDNGFKMMRGRSSFFGQDIQNLRECIETEAYREADRGSMSSADITAAYIEAVVRALKPVTVPAELRVTVDAGNGAAGPLALRTLETLGYTIDPLFCEMDGRFPNHHPDPTVEENLEHLKARVAETKASVGIAFDGDGDRIGVVDAEGQVIWGDKLMILFSRAVLSEHPAATILGEVKCSETLFHAIREAGGRAIMCRTGHSLIKERMKQEKALLAGEMSGHIFFADRYFGFDDAIYAAARLLEILVDEGKSLSELLGDVPLTYVTPEIRMPCPDDAKFAVVDRVRRHYEADHEVSSVDGARVDFGEGAWGLCRASNTGPVLVLRFEALTAERRDALRADFERVVENAKKELSVA
ncbi:MAG: phosphomannomutase/phosphoglucomutase, partial [Polyangiaceae bacterium]